MHDKSKQTALLCTLKCFSVFSFFFRDSFGAAVFFLVPVGLRNVANTAPRSHVSCPEFRRILKRDFGTSSVDAQLANLDSKEEERQIWGQVLIDFSSLVSATLAQRGRELHQCEHHHESQHAREGSCSGLAADVGVVRPGSGH